MLIELLKAIIYVIPIIALWAMIFFGIIFITEYFKK